MWNDKPGDAGEMGATVQTGPAPRWLLRDFDHTGRAWFFVRLHFGADFGPRHFGPFESEEAAERFFYAANRRIADTLADLSNWQDDGHAGRW